MKICPECGAANEDSYRFCLSCGAKLGEESVPETEAAPVYDAPVPVYAPAGCGATLNEVMGSSTLLAAAILTTLSFAMTVVAAFFAQNVLSTLGDAFANLMVSLYNSGVIPFYDLESMILYTGADFSSIPNVGINYNVTYSVNIGAIVAPVILWIIWGTAHSGKTSKTVFVILKVFSVIGLVIVCIASAAIVAGCALAVFYGVSTVDPEYAVFIRIPVYAGVGCLLALAVIAIISSVCSVRTWGSLSKACDGINNGKISVIAAALYIWSGVHSLVFAILGAAASVSILPILALSAAASACAGAAQIIVGYVLIKAKVLLAKAQ